jgi:hypothetical protein
MFVMASILFVFNGNAFGQDDAEMLINLRNYAERLSNIYIQGMASGEIDSLFDGYANEISGTGYTAILKNGNAKKICKNNGEAYRFKNAMKVILYLSSKEGGNYSYDNERMVMGYLLGNKKTTQKISNPFGVLPLASVSECQEWVALKLMRENPASRDDFITQVYNVMNEILKTGDSELLKTIVLFAGD